MKYIIAVGVLMLTTVAASADHRHHRHHRHHHFHGHHHHHKPNYGAYVAGALALGIAGAVIYDRYGRYCRDRIVGYDMYDRPVVRRICE